MRNLINFVFGWLVGLLFLHIVAAFVQWRWWWLWEWESGGRVFALLICTAVAIGFTAALAKDDC